ncbi:hypothetical protein DAEQUDRAFT_718573 [Daedalea quercina L-15889]|uniref:Uncharacterized protein n=1 Tax=Daedalea quercina L-15889 TaxID=1314783 RepID=A0A165L978_9APHY|nr:hypothetical protein DAEQUDRAFT_718573 [Daedalea quercina L-15889]
MAQTNHVNIDIRLSVPNDEYAPIISIPKTIQRPRMPPVMSDKIAQFEPELADVPVEYAREALKCRVNPPRPAFSAKEVNLLVTDAGLSCLPTHALAVHPPANPSTGSPSERANRLDCRGREVTVRPIHAVVLAAHCGRLPADMPKSRPRPPPGKIIYAGGEIANGYRIPLVPFCVPEPEAFEPLVRYMYTHDTDELLNELVRMKVPFDVSGNRTPLYASNPSLRQGVAQNQRLNRIASECFAYHDGDVSQMYQQAMFIEGFRRNAVAVAMSDEDMWETLQLAWEAVVRAMTWAQDANAQIKALQMAEAVLDVHGVKAQTPEGIAASNASPLDRHVQTQLDRYVQTQLDRYVQTQLANGRRSYWSGPDYYSM